jgi:hypothetical protein
MQQDVSMSDYESTEDISDLKPSQAKSSIDFSEYAGKKYPIERITRTWLKSKFGPAGVTLAPGKEIMAPVLKVETIPVTTVTNREGQEIEIRASEIFSLIEEIDNEGKKTYTWSQNEKGALFKFLKKMKVTSPPELKGKMVILTTRGEEPKEFLGFIKD